MFLCLRLSNLCCCITMAKQPQRRAAPYFNRIRYTRSVRMERKTRGISAHDIFAVVLTLWFANSSLGITRQWHFYIGCVMHGWGSLSWVCRYGDPGVVPGQLVWDFWWKDLYRDRFFSGYLGFSMSVSCHQGSVLVLGFFDRSYNITVDDVITWRT